MVADCIAHSLRCDKCQRHAPTLHQPPEEMSSISYLYPFMKWSMDVLGPMEASGGMKRLKNLLVFTDYSTKWIEAKAFQQVTKKQVEDFLWENIVCQHGIPYEIVTDNETNLTSEKIKVFCDKWNIRLTTQETQSPECKVLHHGRETYETQRCKSLYGKYLRVTNKRPHEKHARRTMW